MIFSGINFILYFEKKFFNFQAKELNAKTGVEICVLISHKNKVESYFSTGSVFDRNIKQKLQFLLGDEYVLAGSGFGNGREEREIQCAIANDSYSVQKFKPTEKQ